MGLRYHLLGKKQIKTQDFTIALTINKGETALYSLCTLLTHLESGRQRS